MSRALDEFRPSTDLGFLFAESLREVEARGYHPTECKNQLAPCYQNYTQKGDGWEARKDAVFLRYMQAVDQAQRGLVDLRDARENRPFRWPRRLPFWPSFILLMILKYGLGITKGVPFSAAIGTMLLVFGYNAGFVHAARWAHRRLGARRYQRGLGKLLAEVDARGDDLPALQIGEGTPRLQLPATGSP